jgi:hypothetical protein
LLLTRVFARERAWWGRNADNYGFPRRARRADPVCGDAVHHRHWRPVAAVRLPAEPQHAGAGAVGHRVSRRRGRRRVALRAGGGRPQRLGGWRRQRLAVHRLWLHVVRRAQLRRPARQRHRAGPGTGAVAWRIPIRQLRAIAAGAHQPGCGDQRGLRSARRARIVVRARPRSDLALADTGAGDRACGFSSGTHSLRTHTAQRRP